MRFKINWGRHVRPLSVAEALSGGREEGEPLKKIEGSQRNDETMPVECAGFGCYLGTIS